MSAWILPILLISSVTSQYNETAAKMMLNLAAGAYGNDSMRQACVQRTFSSNQNQQMVSSFRETCDGFSNTCSGYIVVSDVLQQISVVFRGTKTTSQLLLEGWTTINPEMDYYDLGRVNKYFGEASETLWSNVLSVLSNPSYSNYHVYFTGHSLGAALACLAAVKSVQQGLRQSNQVTLLTFGEPRVGNSVFANNVNNLVPDSYRVVNAADIIPHTPGCAKIKDMENSIGSKPCDPENINKGYQHLTEIWYPNTSAPGNGYIVCDGWAKGEDFNCSDSLKWDLSDTSEAIFMHRHYFGFEVPDYGKNGCDPNLPDGTIEEQKPALLDKVASFVSDLFG